MSLFVSYSRQDADFALRVAEELKAAGRKVWLDQFEISLGDHWDRAVQQALEACTALLVVLSPAAVASDNVADEYHFALEEKKLVIPLLHQKCKVPLRLCRLQYADFLSEFASGLNALLKVLTPEPVTDPNEVRGRRWLIGGQVQGVGFRFFASRKATELGLGGWVHALTDGRMDVYATGPVQCLQAFGEALRTGPAAAKVQSVEIEESEAPAGDRTEFRVR